MRKNVVSRVFDLPEISYFLFGNPYYGSLGDLNYRIVPNDELELSIWHGKNCAAKSEIEQTLCFPKDAEGLTALARELETYAPAGYEIPEEVQGFSI